MAETNLEVVKRGYEALASGGFEAWLPLFDEAFVMTTPAALASEPGTYRGPEGVQRWFEEFDEAMEEVRLEAHDFLEVGDWVVVPFAIVARGRSTGLQVEQHAVQAWLLRDGKAVQLKLYAELDEALAAVADEES